MYRRSDLPYYGGATVDGGLRRIPYARGEHVVAAKRRWA